ncbi:MAG TPA: FtsX-like permease family protein [Candidatus Baltobacteraceae bacterium]|nr:FtsX-like permease family protein [Candidatus Baltobacteraceae bacterium]
MEIQDIFWLSFRDLSEKKVRTALTVVMVMIGVAAIIGLTSVTAGVNQSISSSLNSLGPTSIIVSSSGAVGFTVADSSKVSSLPNVASVTPLLTGSASLLAGNQNTSVTIIGTTSQGLKQLLGGNVSIYQGSVYQDTIAPIAVVGHDVAFPTTGSGAQSVVVGQTATLKIGGRSGTTVGVPIAGILESHGGFIIPIDTGVIMSLTAAELLMHRPSYNEMLVLASNTSTVNSTAALISNIYGNSARVTTTAELIQTTSSILGSITLLFAVIAGVSLVVAAIGIMNIMLIAVYERTHEIGILKSVGFKNKHILMIFLIQALIIGIIGGVLGIVVGAGGAYGLSTVLGSGSGSAGAGGSPAVATSGSGGGGGGFSGGGGGNQAFGGGGGSGGFGGGSSSSSSISFHPVFPLSTIVYAILVAIIVSVAAGTYPAWRASKMEPIDALRTL